MKVRYLNSSLAFMQGHQPQTYYATADDKVGFFRPDGTFSTSNVNWRTKEFVPIEDGVSSLTAHLSQQLISGTPAVGIAFFNQSKEFISADGSYTSMRDSVVPIPTGAKYVSFSALKSGDSEWSNQWIIM